MDPETTGILTAPGASVGSQQEAGHSVHPGNPPGETGSGKKGGGGKVLFVENLTAPRILALLITHGGYREIFYTFRGLWTGSLLRILEGTARRDGIPLVKLEYASFPGSYFGIQEELYFQANDNLFRRYSENLYARMAGAVAEGGCFPLALRKEVLTRYTKRRVKAYLFLNRLLGEGKEVVFVPSDAEDIPSLLSPEFRSFPPYSVPAGARFLNRVKRALHPLFLFAVPFILAGIVVRLLSRGIRVGGTREHYRIGFDILRPGLVNDRGLIGGRSFLYDTGEFHPSRILHVVRDTLESPEAEESLRAVGAPSVELGRLKIPSALVGGILRSFLLGAPWRILGGIGTHNARSFFLVPAIAIMKMTAETEAFYGQYDVDLFISRDEYSPLHIVRTCVARRHGNRTVSFQWVDNCDRGEQTSHIVYDLYALWGDFYGKYLEKSYVTTETRVIGANLYGADHMYRLMQEGDIPMDYRELKEKYTLVGILGSTFGPEVFVTKEITLQFYRDTLELLSRYDHVYCILKPKDPALDAELAGLVRAYPRARLERSMHQPGGMHTYRFLPLVDAVVAICNSSVGLEALMIGKKVLWYELTGFTGHLYARYSPLLVAFNREELARNLDSVFRDGIYVDEATLAEIRERHGYRFDGRVADRFREMCLDLLHAQGSPPAGPDPLTGPPQPASGEDI